MTEPYEGRTFTRHFISGFMSNLLVSIIRVPLDFAKCRQQICTEKFIPTCKMLKKFWVEKRLYTGTTMTLMRDLIPGGSFLAFFFTYRDKLEEYNHYVNPLLARFCFGGALGIAYWAIA